MTADDHRDWRLSLGAYALGDLPRRRARGDRRAPRGLPRVPRRAARAGRRGGAPAARRPGPDRGAARCARPPTSAPGSRRRSPPKAPGRDARSGGAAFRFGLGGAVAAAVVAALLAIVVLPIGGGESSPAQEVQLRLRAEWGEHRRNPRTPRLRHRDPHVREGHPLRHPLPRLPARRRRADLLGGQLPLPLGRRLGGRAQLGARSLPGGGDRRPRRRPDLRRAGRARRPRWSSGADIDPT